MFSARFARVMVVMTMFVLGSIVVAYAAPDTVTTSTFTGIAFLHPGAVAVDKSGSVYVADSGNNQIVIKDASGIITTIGNGVSGFSGDGLPIGSATQFNNPQGLAFDSDGSLYVADSGNQRVRKVQAVSGSITAASTISTVAGDGVSGFSGDTLLATASSLKNPVSVAIDSTNNIYIADSGNYRIRKVDASSKKISTVLGDGKATTLTVAGLAMSPADDLYIADPGHNVILKLAKGTTSSTVYAGTKTAGNTGDGGLASFATLKQPSAVSTDGNDVYIVDSGNNSVRKVSIATGVITTQAGAVSTAAINYALFSSPMGIAIDSVGNVYVADMLNNAVKSISASISAKTSASIPGGTYIGTQTVSLTADQLVQVIYYSIDGTYPTVVYSAPLAISSTTTLKYRSVDLLGNLETVSTATYSFVSAPVTSLALDLTPVSGVYYSARTNIYATLTSSSAGSTIYYTTDGTKPTTASSKYTSPIAIPVPSTTVLKYFSVDIYGNSESVITSPTYVTKALLTSPSVVGATYIADQYVKLTANDTSATIYFTINGVDPLPVIANQYTSGTLIPVTTDTTLKYFAVDKANYNETIKTQSYFIDKVIPVVTASPLPLAVVTNSAQTITLTSTSPDDVIYYSVDGKTVPSTKYTAPLTFTKTTTLLFFSKDTAGNQSVTTTLTYLIDTTAPITTPSLKGAQFASIQSVTLITNDTTATTYFTTDGTTPSVLSTKYTAPIYIDRTTSLKFFSVDPAGNAESVQTEVYTIIELVTSAYPPGGTYAANQTVTLLSNATGATIYYTTDGTTPTVTGKTTKKYTAPILVTDTTNPASTVTVLQYFSVDKAGVVEKVKADTYRVDGIVPATVAKCITIDPVTSTATNKISLTVNDSADIAPTVYYIANTATNNGTPISAYTLATYSGQISYTGNTIIKFFATDAAGNTEVMKTAYCPDNVTVSASPSIYLETIGDLGITPATTLYIRGNVAPFFLTSSALTINGTAVAFNPNDGSFSDALSMPLGGNTLTVTANDGVSPATTITRTISQNVLSTSATVAIGASNGVVGYDVRVPVTVTSGYQAAAITIDVGYNAADIGVPRVELSPLAKALGKTALNSSVGSANPYRVVIADTVGSSFVPLPDSGTLAYLVFHVAAGAGTTTPLANTTAASNMATNIGAVTMNNVAVTSGAVTVVSNPGDSNADGALTLNEILMSLMMLVDPTTTPVNGAVDLNADGKVSIWEVQEVINAFVK